MATFYTDKKNDGEGLVGTQNDQFDSEEFVNIESSEVQSQVPERPMSVKVLRQKFDAVVSRASQVFPMKSKSNERGNEFKQ